MCLLPSFIDIRDSQESVEFHLQALMKSATERNPGKFSLQASLTSATDRNPGKFSLQASLKSATVRNLGPRSEWVIEAPRRSLKINEIN